MAAAVGFWCVADLPISRGGWGVDACLTRHVAPGEVPAYLSLLRPSGVGFLRERDVGHFRPDIGFVRDAREGYATLTRNGYKTIAFAHLPFPYAAPRAGNELLEDLSAVYMQGRTLGRQFGARIAAFEMVGEPDLAYCRDLPDRVVAYQKALYLGIKAGAAERGGNQPLVVMGALGFPASPWVERAAKSGLLDYTDSYNFHFYGHAEYFRGVIDSHRALLKELKQHGWAPSGDLPFWVTECGLDAVRKDDFLNAERRQLQADFTIRTAREALAATDVGLFMPFILVHDQDPYAMTISARQPLPAWKAYAEFTRTHPWPNRPLARAPHSPHPVVVQWLPDNATTLPLKVGGTYRFRPGRPIKGSVRIYNFSAAVTKGTLSSRGIEHFRVVGLEQQLEIPAFGMRELQVTLMSTAEGRFRDGWELTYRDHHGDAHAFVGIESAWDAAQFVETPLALQPLPGDRTAFPQSRYEPGVRLGPWSTMNGLVGRALADGSYEFAVENVVGDPLYSTMAMAQVNGLPREGLLRVKFDRALQDAKKLRVILVDGEGRRFTVWENCGVDYYGPQDELRLDVRDFHPYAWGKVDTKFRIEPASIREVQLRFYFAKANDPLAVRLSWLTPLAASN